ncbi:transcriptional regulator [Flavobacterium dankookense]|nr:transcriptional regulator [Flavobacterium dankookense]
MRDNDPNDLGNYIQWHIEQNKIKKKSVSDYLNIQPNTLNQYFKQKSFQFSILWRISLAVKHNFLMQLGEELGIAYETKAEKELKAQLLEKEAEIEKLKTQVEVYKEISAARG